MDILFEGDVVTFPDLLSDLSNKYFIGSGAVSSVFDNHDGTVTRICRDSNYIKYLKFCKENNLPFTPRGIVIETASINEQTEGRFDFLHNICTEKLWHLPIVLGEDVAGFVDDVTNVFVTQDYISKTDLEKMFEERFSGSRHHKVVRNLYEHLDVFVNLTIFKLMEFYNNTCPEDFWDVHCDNFMETENSVLVINDPFFL